MDITMCKNKDCPVHGKCWRYMALPNFEEVQWYLPESVALTQESGCEYYWELEEF